MGENHFAPLPTALYGVVLLMASMAYLLLQSLIVSSAGEQSMLKRALGRDWKGKISVLAYLTAIGVSHWLPWMAQLLYVVVALMWLIPDRRIERVLQQEDTP